VGYSKSSRSRFYSSAVGRIIAAENRHESPLIRSATMDVLLSMIKSKALVDRYDDRDIFHAYYAVAQLVLLSTPRKGQWGGAMTLGMKRYKSQRAACVEAICKGIEELDDPIETHQFRDRMMLCR
uniref:Uncharacterized protein n=1 Tax=Parascaris univalens TaxID=6257 RepID=A0A915B272_PARUN